MSILAVLFYVAILFGFDLKYYLHPLTFNDNLPILANFGGVGVFFLLLALMWRQALPVYQIIFQRTYRPVNFIINNIKTNLPILLPWFFLSLAFDCIALLNLKSVDRIMHSEWGSMAFFVLFVIVILFVSPPMVRRMWNCTPMQDGPLKSEIKRFFKKQNFSAEIFIWPLFEGHVVTAGVMGLVPSLRYVLVTPALLRTMDWDELESVLAHEIGHVKKNHLLLYLLLFIGFFVLLGSVSGPLFSFILLELWFYKLSFALNVEMDVLLNGIFGMFLLLSLLGYFRFVFGYFIRNFERQADSHVFTALDESSALISSFEKIAGLSGNIREKKNWHHFGIGERVDFLERCNQDRSLVRKHDLKVKLSLVFYFVFIAMSVWLMSYADFSNKSISLPHRLEALIQQELKHHPDNWELLRTLGNLSFEMNKEREAIHAYEKALQLNPSSADLNNSLAWILLTAQDNTLHDPFRALSLARKAVSSEEEPIAEILDTLAVALWANGMRSEAIVVQREAIAKDPADREEFKVRLQKMMDGTWGQ